MIRALLLYFNVFMMTCNAWGIGTTEYPLVRTMYVLGFLAGCFGFAWSVVARWRDESDIRRELT